MLKPRLTINPFSKAEVFDGEYDGMRLFGRYDNEKQWYFYQFCQSIGFTIKAITRFLSDSKHPKNYKNIYRIFFWLAFIDFT